MPEQEDEVPGLVFGALDDDVLQTRREDARAFSDLTAPDRPDRRRAFREATTPDLDEIGRITPETGSTGLSLGGDLDRLDAGLGELDRLAANSRGTRLVTQAREKIAQGRFHTALTLLDQALEIDPESAVVIGLQAFCAGGVGEYERALDRFDRAGQLATDPETALVVSGLRADCAAVIGAALDTEATARIEAGEFDAAVAGLDRYVDRLPEVPLLRYHHAFALVQSDRDEEALASLDAGLRTATGENAEVLGRLRGRVQQLRHRPAITGARDRLRAGDAKGAILHLERCPAEMREYGDVRLLWNYANDRQASRSLFASRRRKRMAQAGAVELEQEELEAVLVWLLSDELDAGTEALGRERYRDACAHYAAAEAIDDRCTTAAYWFAVANVLLSRSQESSLDECEHLLVEADIRRRVAAEDPDRAEAATQLAEVIRADLVEVRLILRVTGLVKQYNTVMGPVARRAVRDIYELNRIRGRIDGIRGEAIALHRECTGRDDLREVLDNLVDAITKALG